MKIKIFFRKETDMTMKAKPKLVQAEEIRDLVEPVRAAPSGSTPKRRKRQSWTSTMSTGERLVQTATKCERILLLLQ